MLVTIARPYQFAVSSWLVDVDFGVVASHVVAPVSMHVRYSYESLRDNQLVNPGAVPFRVNANWFDVRLLTFCVIGYAAVWLRREWVWDSVLSSMCRVNMWCTMGASIDLPGVS